MQKRLKDFIHNETSGGLCLMGAALLALIVANSDLSLFYRQFLDAKIGFGLNINDMFFGLDKPLALWINDALMALFFLLVGAELKREVLTGALSAKDKALQPLFAALGGVVVPVLFFLAVNGANPETMRGWAIGCATDIAFALGVLAFLGPRIPAAIKILLLAIAIIDDLAAILVIALFYTETLHVVFLLWATAGAAALLLLNRFRVARLGPYILAGCVIWAGFLQAGLHPTLAGVVTALAVPLRTPHHAAPLLALEKKLHPWIVFAVLPLFAFANAGLALSDIALAAFFHPLTLGIMLALGLGKPLGIMAGLAAGHVSGLARKPQRIAWQDYTGMACLCGIGFTMSLFIGELAFDDAQHLQAVKLGVLSASSCMAVIGWFLCRLTFERKSHV